MSADRPLEAPAQKSGAVEPQHYTYIDALRGIAILGVFVFHAAASVPGFPSWPHEFAERGSSGVQLFYVLSAFTLCESFRARAGDRSLVGKYLLRRVFRIVPMFWLSLLVYFALHGFRPFTALSISDYILTLTLMHGFSVPAINGIVPGGWSVTVETQFYLLLPFVFWYASTLRRALVLLGLSVIVSLASIPVMEAVLFPRYPANWHWAVHDFAYFSLANQLPVFLVGVVAYRLMGPDRDLLERLEHRVPLRALALVGALLIILPFRHSVPGHLGYAVMAMLLLYALAKSRFALLDNPVARFYGKISYSAYLLHFGVLSTLVHAVPGVGSTPLLRFAFMLVAGLAITTLVASITQAWVETPGINLGRKVSKWIFNRRTPMVAASQPAAIDPNPIEVAI